MGDQPLVKVRRVGDEKRSMAIGGSWNPVGKLTGACPAGGASKQKEGSQMVTIMMMMMRLMMIVHLLNISPTERLLVVRFKWMLGRRWEAITGHCDRLMSGFSDC